MYSIFLHYLCGRILIHDDMKALFKTIFLTGTLLMFIGCEQTGGAASDITNTGDDSSDFVEEQKWESTINIVWNGTEVSVTGTADSVRVSVTDGYVTVNSDAKHIVYAVSGNGTGQLSVYSTYKYQLAFQGLTLHCPDAPAVNNQCHKTCYAVLNGENSLSDGTTYAASTEDRKATFFSEGQVCFSGAGSLNVTGNCKHAIACDDYVRFCKGTGTVTLTANASDGLHTNDGVIINDGNIIIQAAGEGIQCDTSSVVVTGGTVRVTSPNDKGILAYGNIDISGGVIEVTSKYKCIKTKSNLTVSGGVITAVATGSSSNGGRGWGGESSSEGTPEGIEAKGTITISGGQVYAQANDDAINSGGDMTISGGCVCAYSTGNDGLDANGDCYIKGGLVYAIGASAPEVAVDANTEERHQLYVEGGTIVAIGGLENGSSLTQACYSASSWSAGKWYSLTVGDEVFAFTTPDSGGTPLVVSGASTPTLLANVTASGTAIFNNMGYYPATVSGGTNVSLSSYTGGNGGGRPGGGGDGGDRPGGGGDGGGRPGW